MFSGRTGTRSGIHSFFDRRCISAVISVMTALPMCTAFAASDGVVYDIPISELNKVTKKSPGDKTSNTGRKKKKGKPGVQETAAAEVSRKAGPDPAAQTKPQTTAEAPGEDIRIHHSPYSFIVAGKRTVIHAVINSRADIKEVSCSVQSAAGSVQAVVPMTKVDGTLFTYTATLPSPTPDSPALRYTITASDTQGKVVNSSEFSTPVTSSPVVPSWQTETTAETSEKAK